MISGLANTVRFFALLALALSPLAAGAQMAAGAQAATTHVTEGYVNAPIAEVWKLFTTAQGYSVLGIAQAQVDLRVGGHIRTHEAATGTLEDSTTVVHEILAYDPERMIALRISQPPADFPYRNAAAGTWSVIYFTPSGADMTHVRIVDLGYADDPQSQALRRYFAESHRRILDQAAKRYWPKCKLCAADETQTAEPDSREIADGS